MGIAGSVTSAVSSTSVTLPVTGLTFIGVSVYAHTVSGYCTIPIDSSKNALIPFSASVAVTTAKVPATQVMDHGGIVHVTWNPSGLTMNYTGVGLTSGTFAFYYGTPFADNRPILAYAGIAVSYTTGTSLAFTFPGGPLTLTGIVNIIGTDTAQTTLQIQDSWNTSSGRSVLVSFSENSLLEVQALDNLPAAQSLTVTQAYSGTHVGTGYLIIYYAL